MKQAYWLMYRTKMKPSRHS